MSTAQWVDAIARTAAEVPGIRSSHAAGTGGQGAKVHPMTDQLDITPAAVVGVGAFEMVAATWQRRTHEVLLTIWIPRIPVGPSYAQAVEFIDTLPPVFEAHALAWNADTNNQLQSVVIKSCDGIQAQEWPAASGKWFLVLPWHLEAKVNRPADYQPS